MLVPYKMAMDEERRHTGRPLFHVIRASTKRETSSQDCNHEGCYHDPSILEATRKRRIFGQGGKRLLEKVSQELYRSHLVPGYWKPQSLEQRMDRPCRGV